MSRMLLDAGALIALDRGDRDMWRRWERARRDEIRLVTHGGVVAQAWRGPKQVRLALAVRALDVVPLDRELGRATGQLLAASKTSDIADAALVVVSRDGDRIVTSDPTDLLRLATVLGRDVEIVAV